MVGVILKHEEKVMLRLLCWDGRNSTARILVGSVGWVVWWRVRRTSNCKKGEDEKVVA